MNDTAFGVAMGVCASLLLLFMFGCFLAIGKGEAAADCREYGTFTYAMTRYECKAVP